MFLPFFSFIRISNLRAFNIAFSSIPTAPTKISSLGPGRVKDTVAVLVPNEDVTRFLISGAGLRRRALESLRQTAACRQNS